MAITTKQAIFLGNFADADSTDGSPYTLENPSIYLGVFGSSGSPLYQNSVDVTIDDTNDSGDLATNDVGSETLQVDVGSGLTTAMLDSLVVVDLTVTYTNGTVTSYSNAVMFQDTNGNLFLTNSNFAGTDISGPSAIESVNVTAITGDGYTGLFHNAMQAFICYVEGSLIRTPSGDVPVELLKAGDLVATLDYGPQKIRWIKGSWVVPMGRLAPVQITANALGPGMPTRDLFVSRQHRMLVRSRLMRQLTGTEEGLVAAIKLVGLAGIKMARPPPGRPLRYFHLFCDRHEIIFANDAPAETLLPGPQALEMMGPEARAELEAIFSETDLSDACSRPARQILEGPQSKRLISRHARKDMALVSTA